MASEVISAEDLEQPIIRRKTLSARNDADMMTVIDTGEYGLLDTDEPVPTVVPDKDPPPSRPCSERCAVVSRLPSTGLRPISALPTKESTSKQASLSM